MEVMRKSLGRWGLKPGSVHTSSMKHRNQMRMFPAAFCAVRHSISQFCVSRDEYSMETQRARPKKTSLESTDESEKCRADY